MNECQIYQLLRDMEVVDENGDFLWEEQQDDNTEPMHIFEDEEKIFDPEGSLSNQKEFVLPQDIMPNLKELNLQPHTMGQCSDCSQEEDTDVANVGG